MELVIVIIIIGILATLALVHYGSYKERTLDKEAQANLKLVIAAEKIYRMESGFYYNSGTVQTAAITNINDYLRLLLSTANNRSWNYHTTADATPAACAQATRNDSGTRTWRMRHDEEAPQEDQACP